MFPYRPGDIVRVHNYPYAPKAEQSPNDPSSQGKGRFGVVINAGGRSVTAVPVLQVMSHGGKTENNEYVLREDEVRVPPNTSYQRRDGAKTLNGVIKTERIETFEADEITAPLTAIPLRTKMDLLDRYEAIKEKPYFKNMMDKQSPNHEFIMKNFRESVVAEKLNFLVNESGERLYDKMRNSSLNLTELNKIGSLGKGRGNKMGIYSVKLEGSKDAFYYTIGTHKNKKQIAKDWSKPKPAKDWIREDIKYHVLNKNLDKVLKPEPKINQSKYQSMESFKKSLNPEQEKGL